MIVVGIDFVIDEFCWQFEFCRQFLAQTTGSVCDAVIGLGRAVGIFDTARHGFVIHRIDATDSSAFIRIGLKR